ncbi:MAG: phage terminase large subunit [Clostridia bacterium]|nr:phage terminase large subunit [Clostridia bacterium]
MELRNIVDNIRYSIERAPHVCVGYKDLYSVARELLKNDEKFAVEQFKWLSAKLEKMIPEVVGQDISEARKMTELHRQVLLEAAPYDFDSYLLYVEMNREPEKKFYPPRRKVLKQVVDELQRLADDELDLLSISLPPGSGKTTLAIFYLTWLAGKIPDEPMLAGSHSNSFVRGVYDECLRIFDPNGDYLWHDVFPTVEISNTNAKDCRIDLGKRKRFETLEFTSIGSGNAGLYRAATLLYCDDLVSGIEVALSKERLDKLWQTYTTDLRQRKIGDKCKELHIATRWSVHDVIGRLEMEYGGSSRAKFIVIPVVNEQDESNFDYAYGKGFSTRFCREQREIMDEVSWKALYMNQPIEREGRLYDSDELRRFFYLPETSPDAIIAVCDTKDRGKDYAVLPVAMVYGQDYYICEALCDNSNPDVVDVRMTDILVRRKVQVCRFESNSAGGRVAQKIQQDVKNRGGITRITTKYTTENKETKIIVHSSWIKEHCLFLDESMYKRGSEYGRFMDMLCSYTMTGKNAHDDVPDAMAMLSDFAQGLGAAKVEVIKRPF